MFNCIHFVVVPVSPVGAYPFIDPKARLEMEKMFLQAQQHAHQVAHLQLAQSGVLPNSPVQQVLHVPTQQPPLASTSPPSPLSPLQATAPVPGKQQQFLPPSSPLYNRTGPSAYVYPGYPGYVGLPGFAYSGYGYYPQYGNFAGYQMTPQPDANTTTTPQHPQQSLQHAQQQLHHHQQLLLLHQQQLQHAQNTLSNTTTANHNTSPIQATPLAGVAAMAATKQIIATSTEDTSLGPHLATDEKAVVKESNHTTSTTPNDSATTQDISHEAQ
jgi:hypothetical protein